MMPSGLILPPHLKTKPKPQVDVYIHPIDTVKHPSYQAKFRWAVMIGGAPPDDLDRCMNAGGCETLAEASMVGEAVGSAVTIALRAFGIDAKYRVVNIPFDPIPASADDRPLVKCEDD
jgi:hypothetical protein